MTDSAQHRQAGRRFHGAWWFTAAGLLVGSVLWWGLSQNTPAPSELFEQAQQARRDRDLPLAEQLAADAFSAQPDLLEAAMFAAECALLQNEFDRALSYLQQIEPVDSSQQLEIALRIARIHDKQRHAMDAAEEAYRSVLEIDSENIEAHTSLAQLLGLSARRQAAIPHILALIDQDVSTDLLVLLSRESGVIQDRERLEKAMAANPTGLNALLGLAWIAAEQERFDQAIRLCRQAVAAHPQSIDAHESLGRYLLEAENFEQLEPWQNDLPASAKNSAVVWMIRGRVAEQLENQAAAARCYWEAARRWPESRFVSIRLAQLLTQIGKQSAADEVATHVERLSELQTVQDQFLFPGERSEPLQWNKLIQAYEDTGRLWEAYGWCLVAYQQSQDPKLLEQTNRLREQLKSTPYRLTIDARNPARQFNLADLPLPELRSIAADAGEPKRFRGAPLSFREESESLGIRFRYFQGITGTTQHRMFEFTGGGIAVLDYDRDGYFDISFSQGRPWPPQTGTSDFNDRLYRNRLGQSFQDVTELIGLQEQGFGQGVTVGDFNADGFPDLYVANIGVNQLWRNNGDGTFSDWNDRAGIVGEQWTTSSAMVDIDGDRFPDIYDVNYVTGPDVFDRVCRGQDGKPLICMPFHFDAEPDRLWINNGDGTFIDQSAEVFPSPPTGKGLGIAAWDAHGQGRLSLLVANDTLANNFYVTSVTSDGRPRIRDLGIPSGLAFNGQGKAEGCMGIGLADLDHRGFPDVFITNYLNESNTLYRCSPGALFEDSTKRFQLHSSSLSMVGFGTQFLDADLDGEFELFATNGHVDDMTRLELPYRMRPQLYRYDGGRFTQLTAQQLGPYFEHLWVGRAAALIDWNNDQRRDLLVGHLNDPSALLTNATSDYGNGVSVRLVGTTSNRDAIGTRLIARTGQRQFVHQLTAGDGYQSSNERRLIIGCGPAKAIEELEIHWPSGQVESIRHVKTGQELIVIEGGGWFTLP